MSRSLFPQEISDYFIDFLHGEHITLRKSYLVSKSWVPHSRKYLFRELTFRSLADLDAWKENFLGPVDSPGHYTRSLFIVCPQVTLTAAVEDSGWVQAFSNVVRLRMGEGMKGLLFRFLLRLLETCCVGFETWSASSLFNLICSLPLLEDLEVMGLAITNSPIPRPSTSPPFTGALRLCLPRWRKSTLRQLLSLPNGIRFRKLKCG